MCAMFASEAEIQTVTGRVSKAKEVLPVQRVPRDSLKHAQVSERLENHTEQSVAGIQDVYL